MKVLKKKKKKYKKKSKDSIDINADEYVSNQNTPR
jgi:hypothetical protein